MAIGTWRSGLCGATSGSMTVGTARVRAQRVIAARRADAVLAGTVDDQYRVGDLGLAPALVSLGPVRGRIRVPAR